MFASKKTDHVTIIDEDEVVIVTIRKLSAKSLDNASDVRSQASLAKLKHMGGEIAKAFREPVDFSKVPKVEDPKAEAEARYATYDRATVIRAGVQSWTSSIPVETGVDDLDDEAADKLHRAILDLSLPPLKKAEAEAIPKGA